MVSFFFSAQSAGSSRADHCWAGMRGGREWRVESMGYGMGTSEEWGIWDEEK